MGKNYLLFVRNMVFFTKVLQHIQITTDALNVQVKEQVKDAN